MSTLEIRNLHVNVEDKEILKGVDLTVNTGEVHALMGPNGNGKSTLLMTIMGHPRYKVTEGSITFDGQDVLAMSVDQRSKAGLFIAMQYPQEVPGVTNSDFLKAAVNADRIVGAVQAIVLGIMVLGTLAYVLCKDRIRTRNVSGYIVPVLIGLFLGICSSFLGIGGGPMNLAVLYYFFSMTTKQAAVNSILIILLSQTASLIMTIATGTVPEFAWGNLLAMVGAGALGGFISARLHKKLSAELTDKLFVGLLIVIFFICVYNAVRMLS